MTTNFEKYLAGEPINEELAAVRAGLFERPGIFPINTGSNGSNQSHEPIIEPFSRADRVALKDLLQGPGWLALQKLLKNATLSHQNSATLISADDPLANAQKIAEQWAYLGMYKRVQMELVQMVGDEIAKLDEEPAE